MAEPLDRVRLRLERPSAPTGSGDVGSAPWVSARGRRSTHGPSTRRWPRACRGRTGPTSPTPCGGSSPPWGGASSIPGPLLPVWDDDAFGFITDDAPCPDTVNPSLWRQSQLCRKGGLFAVTDRIYQVRNADISNLTIVEGDTGLIVFDPLISTETAAAAMELYFAHRPASRSSPSSTPTATSTTTAA